MTKEDREQIREMLTDILTGQMNVVNGKIDVMYVHITQIKEQTTKTNGRVNGLEDRMDESDKLGAMHVLNCPHTEEIKKLQSNELTRSAIMKFTGKVAVIVSGAIAGVVAFLEWILK